MYDFLLGSILNMALSCIIYEIKRDIGRKLRFFIPNLHSTPLLGGPTLEYRRKIWRRNTRMVGLPDGEKKFTGFDTIHKRDGHPTGQTDEQQTPHDSTGHAFHRHLLSRRSRQCSTIVIRHISIKKSKIKS